MRKGFQFLVLIGLLASGCSSEAPAPVEEFYDVPFRRHSPEPVYSRLTWSHPPQPQPEPAHENAPLLQPVIAFEFPGSNLKEAIQALAQTIGYRWDYPPALAARKISIKKVGTVEEILSEIGRQAGVKTELDHDGRMVRVLHTGTAPELPRSDN